MPWLLLMLAIAAEVAGTTFMKLSMGFTKLVPSILLIVFYLLSLSLLNLALKGIPVSVAYAIWSGMGTAFVVGVGWVLFGEQLTTLKLVSMLLIIIGVVGMNLGGGSHGKEKNTNQQEHSIHTTGQKE
ncbi:multidrug efflux SMR transporter [Paenibacillus sp. N1-5-1-14]|uniref:DMT family transporter n=1 Tax=Paenibacillus radicibacter TaxID=2972488 RepID=UPI0021590E39|nr:multidrug efflux SMR transporter [Paenibacillus radicibacter]MCR8645420.1 multidrug efflux SMR transporter [Paenibacillus radicibacter]